MNMALLPKSELTVKLYIIESNLFNFSSISSVPGVGPYDAVVCKELMVVHSSEQQDMSLHNHTHAVSC